MAGDPIQKPAEAVQTTRAPTAKVVAATGGSAVATAVAVLVNRLLGTMVGEDLSEPIQAAIATLVTAGITFWAAWATPHAAGERVVQLPDGTTKSATLDTN